MKYLYFGIIFVLVGFYLWIKGIFFRIKGIHVTATLTGFSNKNNTHYPLFTFTEKAHEYTIPGANPVNDPDKYKYHIGDRVNIIYVPGNTKYVDLEGSYAVFIWGVVSLVWGACLLFVHFRK